MLYQLFQVVRVLAFVPFLLAIVPAPALVSSVTAPFSSENRTSAPAAVVVYSQPVNPAGGILASSLRDPDGSDTDQYAWDGFKFTGIQAISEIRWCGAYNPALQGSGGKVASFVVNIYASIPSGGQPDIARGPLAHYVVAGNAGETASAMIAGVQTFDYALVLPAAFQAAAGTKYWVQIEGYQPGAPDWGLCAGIEGDGAYFRRLPGAGENYQLLAGDAAFTLLAPRLEGPKIFLPLILAGLGG